MPDSRRGNGSESGLHLHPWRVLQRGSHPARDNPRGIQGRELGEVEMERYHLPFSLGWLSREGLPWRRIQLRHLRPPGSWRLHLWRGDGKYYKRMAIWGE